MTPVTIEDYTLDYLERSSGCAATLTVPPPAECSSTVQNAYGFLKIHPLTGLLALFFVLVIVEMTLTSLFPKAHH